MGRTTICANLAAALAEDGLEVVVLDADVVHPGVHSLFGLTPHGDTGDLLAGLCTVEDVLLPGPPGVRLIPGGSGAGIPGALDTTDCAALIWAVHALPGRVDVIMVDTAAGPRAEVAAFARSAHHLLVVVCDKPDAVKDALAFIASLSADYGVRHFNVVASQCSSVPAGAALFHRLELACQPLPGVTLRYAGTVPRDEAVPRAMRVGRLVIETDPRSRAARAIHALAAQANSWAPPAEPHGHSEFDVEHLLNVPAGASSAAGAPHAPRLNADSPETLVVEHAALVRRIASNIARRLPQQVELSDLIQVGTMSLLKVAQHYAPAAGASFETYVGIRIRGAILDYLRTLTWGPRTLNRRRRDIDSVRRQIEADTGAISTAADIATALGISTRSYHRTLSALATSRLVSLDDLAPAGGGTLGDQTAYEGAGPAEAAEQEELAHAVVAAMDALPEKERDIMRLYYVDGLCFREIGEQLKVTESRTCQIHGRAIRRLRNSVRYLMPDDSVAGALLNSAAS